MTGKFLFAALLLFAASAATARAAEEPADGLPPLRAGDIPAPIAEAEVGDWALYGTADGSTLRLTVVERGGGGLVIRSETTPPGRRNRRRTAVDEKLVVVDESVRDARDLGPDDTLSRAEVLVDGRKLDVVVVSHVDGDMVRQSWLSGDVPVYGLVRGVRVEGGKTTVALNLREFGSAGEDE